MKNRLNIKNKKINSEILIKSNYIIKFIENIAAPF